MRCQLNSWNLDASFIRNSDKSPSDGHQRDELSPGNNGFNGSDPSQGIQAEECEQTPTNGGGEKVKGEIEHIERDDDDERGVPQRFEEVHIRGDIDFFDPPYHQDDEDDGEQDARSDQSKQVV